MYCEYLAIGVDGGKLTGRVQCNTSNAHYLICSNSLGERLVMVTLTVRTADMQCSSYVTLCYWDTLHLTSVAVTLRMLRYVMLLRHIAFD